MPKHKFPFYDEERAHFIYAWWCFYCRHTATSRDADHILGDVSSSPFNLAPLCRPCAAGCRCHERKKECGGEDRQKMVQSLLNRTFWYLVKNGYTKDLWKEKDHEFLETIQKQGFKLPYNENEEYKLLP